MKRYLSIFLAILMIFSVFTIASVSAEDKAEGLASLPEVKEGFKRYFFLLPDNWFWDESNVVGIYWQGSDTPCEVWPGFETHKADVDNVYYYDVPADVETIIWNNHYINGEIDYANTRYNKRTEWLDVKDIPSGMIAVTDYKWDDTVMDESYAECDWKCYYGSGEYGAVYGKEEENTYRYYFYLPEEWENEDSVPHVYWHYDNPKEAQKTNIEGLYYCDAPQNTTHLAFGNSSDFASNGTGKFLYINCEFKSGKIFVIDFDKTVLDNNYSDREIYRGYWYNYYGDGTYGISEIKGDDFYSCRSFGGDNPAPVIETNRYYFYMPEEWENVMSTMPHIYWWEGTDHCGGFWPGYEAYYENITGLYYYDVPKDVTSIIWNNGVTDTSTPVGIAFQSKNIGTEYYEPGESRLYPEGLESFDNMVYVINFDEMYYELEGPVLNGEWYYYYGNGEYGTTKEKGDVVYSSRQLGTAPNYKRTAPEENEMTLFFLDNSQEYTHIRVFYTVNTDGKEELLNENLISLAKSEKGTLYYVNVPEEIDNVYFFYNADKKTHYIQKNLVHNGLFSLGTLVNGKYDYRAYLLTEDLDIIEWISGDADQNGKVTVQDATKIQKALVKATHLGPKGKLAADFNEDGKITVKDATAIQKHLAGLV